MVAFTLAYMYIVYIRMGFAGYEGYQYPHFLD